MCNFFCLLVDRYVLVSTTTLVFCAGRGRSSIDGLRSLAASFVLGGELSRFSFVLVV